MFRLLGRLKAVDWLLICVLAGFVVAQVYFDIELAVYIQVIMDEMQNLSSTTGSILQIGGMMMLYALGSMACTIVVGFIAAFVSTRFGYNLRASLYAKVQSFSVAEMDQFSTPGLITRSTNDVRQVQMAVIMFLRIAVSAPITGVWAILKIQNVSIPLTVAASLWILLMIVGLAVIFAIAVPKFKKQQKLTDKLNGVTRENLTGIRVVRAYNAEKYQVDKFERVNTDLTETLLFVGKVMALMGPGLMLIMNGITLTIYWLGADIISTGGGLTVSELAAFSNLAMQVLSAFMMLTMLFIMMPRAMVSAGRINEVLSKKISVEDKPQTTPLMCEKGGQIEFDHVYFKYCDSEEYVLKDISFTVNKGQTLAIIGATGSGKTTLVNLIPRLFDATEGTVKVCGVDVRDASQHELHSKIGYVPQKGVLFSGSIKKNICFSGVTDEEGMKRAAQIACAEEFINEKENGYDSEIAQGGKNVSGGQKQRLSIARAVAIDPEIFIFDDSFSALDYKTDKTVRANLKAGTENTTKIIVAQRIGTIMDADEIIVLEKGCIVGKGKHGELLKTCDTYREIALSQLSEEELGL